MSNGDYSRAAKVALEREAASVAGAAQGECSTTLWRAAYNLGRLIGAGVLAESEVVAALVLASTTNGHIKRDGLRAIERTIWGSIEAGRKNPRDVQAHGQGSGHSRERASAFSPAMPREREAQYILQPSDRWLERARKWFDGLNRLPESERAIAERALLERGLDPHKAYTELGIKWNYNQTHSEPLAMWGTDNYTNFKGKSVTVVYLPKGLTIAAMIGGEICGLEIRREQSEVEKFGKYCQVTGSAKPMAYCVGEKGLPVVICESALDAALVYQETGGAFQCIACMGNAKTLPKYHVAIIQQAPQVFYIPDNDKGGEDGTAKILGDFPNVQIKTLPAKVKDPGELAKLHYYGQAQFLPTVREWLDSVGLISAGAGAASQPTADGLSSCQASLSEQSTAPLWCGEYIDGNPCCYWPPYIRKILGEAASLCTDRQGYGIPSQGLPVILKGFGLNGWRVVETQGGNGSLDLVAGRNGTVNEHGCRKYLKLFEAAIREAMKQWEQYNSFYGG